MLLEGNLFLNMHFYIYINMYLCIVLKEICVWKYGYKTHFIQMFVVYVL